MTCFNRVSLIIAGMAATIAFGQTTTSTEPPQTPAPATSPAPAAAPTPSPWTRGGIDFYVLGDVYGDLNFNHPASGVNQLYNFDTKANAAHLNFAKIAMEKASGPIGFRVDLGIGTTVDIMSAADRAPEGMKYLEQVYLEFRPSHFHGIQIDAGKFLTAAGAELTESNANWNYSRGLLFAWAIPYYHLGVRATIPVTKSFSAGVQVVNGWNNVKDNNSGKTVGFSGTYTFKKGTWTNVYYAGPEKNDTNEGFRQLYDTTVVLNPTDKFSTYFNVDFGTDKNIGGGRSNWSGFAAAGRYQLTKRFAVAPRFSFFNDRDGFSTGTAQNLKEFTLTGEMKIRDGFISRLEYRRDASDHPFFDRGADMASARAQSTVALAFIAFFGPKK